MEKARKEWTKTFLENGGFDYILAQFWTKQVSTNEATTLSDKFELKSISFMLILLRVIMSAAFATDNTTNIGEALALVRKSSSIPSEEGEVLGKKLSRR